MPDFGRQSHERLLTCHPDLIRLFDTVVAYQNCTILEGHRGEAAQHAAFVGGKSQLDWPHGKHNALPSLAVDVAPYPIDWNDLDRFKTFAGFVQGVAAMLHIPLRWGGDWDGDPTTRNRFNDLVHFELKAPA